MLSARGEAIDDSTVAGTTRLIRNVFPQTDAFKFQQPTYATFEKLQKLLPPGGALMPAVKVNAYGHGAVLVAKEWNTLGIDAFCVATIFEGIGLPQGGVFGEILIHGYTHPRYVPL